MDTFETNGRTVLKNGQTLITFDTEGDAIAYVCVRNKPTAKLQTPDEAHARAMVVVHRRIRNRVNARARNDAMRSVGMTKTRYGWE